MTRNYHSSQTYASCVLCMMHVYQYYTVYINIYLSRVCHYMASRIFSPCDCLRQHQCNTRNVTMPRLADMLTNQWNVMVYIDVSPASPSTSNRTGALYSHNDALLCYAKHLAALTAIPAINNAWRIPLCLSCATILTCCLALSPAARRKRRLIHVTTSA